MKTQIELTPEVSGILKRCSTTGNVLLLPPQQLNRKTYEAVNAVLQAEGGRWKKGIGHIFNDDAGKILKRMLGNGAAIKQRQVKQSFYTPQSIAMQVAEMADVSGHTVLEPSAGEGALADACMEYGAATVDCIELDPLAWNKLIQKGYAAAKLADFLSVRPTEKYTRIVMNPPFTKGQDMKHVLRAMEWLHRDGYLYTILADTNHPEIEHLEPEILDRFERGAFRSSGTMIATMLIKISK